MKMKENSMKTECGSETETQDRFQSKVLNRKGTFHINGSLNEIFPLLCPKREEDWIPGWQCETIYSESGYNEEGAVFRTTKAYGTELYWTTLQYDSERKYIDFLLNAPRLFNCRFTFSLVEDDTGMTALVSQSFTSLSGEGSALVERISQEDLQERLDSLELHINHYLKTGTMIRA
jgi:hypothetical protein